MTVNSVNPRSQCVFIILPWKPTEMPVRESPRLESIREELTQNGLPVTESGARLIFPVENYGCCRQAPAA
jgi:hypothetical protein